MANRVFGRVMGLVGLLMILTAIGNVTGCASAPMDVGGPVGAVAPGVVVMTTAILATATAAPAVTAVAASTAAAPPVPTPAVTPPAPTPPPPALAATTEASATPETIGLSAGDRPILAHRLGRGAVNVALVGGVHGGYEWNSILLAEQLLSYFQANEAAIPAALTLHIIPNANPDGLFAVTGFDGPFTPADVYADSTPGRFNGNGVDLNRNWDCNWSPVAYWRNRAVPAGYEPFSEPENRALRDYLLAHRPAVVIFFHSAAGAIYVSGCPEPHPPSEALARVYGEAASYPVYPLFDHYAITGDAGDWLTTQEIPSFTVELVTHESYDWEQNIAGMTALLSSIGHQPEPAAVDWTGLQRIR